MSLKSPHWWHRKDGAIVKVLQPVGALYGKAVALRYSVSKPYRSSLPIICVGNFTAGGAGKTPTALMLAKLLKKAGQRPVFLTRGYGGKIAGPHLVNWQEDVAEQVGDEPLLLARRAPTVVSKNRRQGAQFIEEMDASVIVMDDGFQNPTLFKGFSLVVVDGRRGLGNGQLFPAGPLRADLSFQLKRADAILALGEPLDDEVAVQLLELANKAPFLRGSYASREDTDWLTSEALVAYSGIGEPEKFFDFLKGLGAQVVYEQPFGDHHVFRDEDARRLLSRSEELGARLVTTEKDLARLSGAQGLCKNLSEQSKALGIKIKLRKGDQDRLMELINARLAA